MFERYARLARTAVGLGIIVYMAASNRDLSAPWLVLLGGMVGLTTIGKGSKDDPPDKDRA